MKQINEILNRQKQALEDIKKAKNVLANIDAEIEQLGTQILAETQEKLAILGVSHLLNTTFESVTNVTINKGKVVEVVKQPVVNVTINKGKVVKVPVKVENKDTGIAELQDKLNAANKKEEEYKAVVKEYEVENAELKKRIKALEEIVNAPILDDVLVVDGVEIDVDAVKALQEENAELADKISRLKKSSSSFQSNAAKAQNTIKELKDKIADLEKDNATVNKGADTKSEVMNEDEVLTDEYLLHLADNEEEIMAGINAANSNQTIITGPEQGQKEAPKVATITEVATAPKFVNLVSNKLGKSEYARLYYTETCYLIASPSAKEITWITKTPISDEYKKQVEATLVKQYNFNKTRVEVSPITVQDSNGYMARVRGVEGLDVYSNDDVYSGYVKFYNEGEVEFILYSYFPNTDTAIIESLNKKVLESKGKLNPGETTMPDDKKVTRFANSKIRKLYKEYANLTADIRAEHKNNVDESKELFANNQKVADEIQARHDAILAGLNTGGDNINTDNTSVDGDEFRIDLGINNDSYQEIDDEFGAF